MNTNLNVLLSAAAVAALIASPAMAKPHARTSVLPYARAQTVYAPNVPVPPYPVHGVNPDFQLEHP
jgi:hypothetical protein